jgi:CBS domain-containing protein
MIAKKTSKNQLTIPKEIAGQFPDIEYFDISVDGKNIILKPVIMKPADNTLSDIREKMEKLGIKHDDVKDAVTWARKKNK